MANLEFQYKTGFFESLTHQYLGASPDAAVFDPSFPDPNGFADVKCSYKYRHMTPEESSTQSDLFCEVVDGHLQLKRKHKYFAQVQGQMVIGGGISLTSSYIQNRV